MRVAHVSREEVFVTTKLWNSDHGYDRAIAAREQSLAKLGLDYIDHYLIPPARGKTSFRIVASVDRVAGPRGPTGASVRQGLFPIVTIRQTQAGPSEVLWASLGCQIGFWIGRSKDEIEVRCEVVRQPPDGTACGAQP